MENGNFKIDLTNFTIHQSKSNLMARKTAGQRQLTTPSAQCKHVHWSSPFIKAAYYLSNRCSVNTKTPWVSIYIFHKRWEYECCQKTRVLQNLEAYSSPNLISWNHVLAAFANLPMILMSDISIRLFFNWAWRHLATHTALREDMTSFGRNSLRGRADLT